MIKQRRVMSNQLTEFDSSTTQRLCFLYTIGGVIWLLLIWPVLWRKKAECDFLKRRQFWCICSNLLYSPLVISGECDILAWSVLTQIVNNMNNKQLHCFFLILPIVFTYNCNTQKNPYKYFVCTLLMLCIQKSFYVCTH